MISFKNVTKVYKSKNKTTLALDNISFELPNKGFVGLSGKNGSGKTTLLNLLSTIDNDYSGEILIDDCNCKLDCDYIRQSLISYVLQDVLFIDKLDINENLLFINPKFDDKELSKLNLKDEINKKTNQLSGGQKQKFSLLQGILKKSEILLVDEPTSSLDDESTKYVFELLSNIAKDKLVILVSHDMDMMNAYCNIIVKLNEGHLETIKDNNTLSDVIYDKDGVVFVGDVNLHSISKEKMDEILSSNGEFKIKIEDKSSNYAHDYSKNEHSKIIEKNNYVQKRIIEKGILKNTITHSCWFSLIMIILFLITSMFFDFKYFDTNTFLYETLSKNQDSYLICKKAVYHEEEDRITRKKLIDYANKNNISIDICDYISNMDVKYEFYDGPIYKSELNTRIFTDFNNFKFVYGKKPKDLSEIAITDFIADALVKKNDKYNNYSDIINKGIFLDNQNIPVSGIIDTDYEKYNDNKKHLSKKDVIDFDYYQKNLYSSMFYLNSYDTDIMVGFHVSFDDAFATVIFDSTLNDDECIINKTLANKLNDNSVGNIVTTDYGFLKIKEIVEDDSDQSVIRVSRDKKQKIFSDDREMSAFMLNISNKSTFDFIKNYSVKYCCYSYEYAGDVIAIVKTLSNLFLTMIYICFIFIFLISAKYLMSINKANKKIYFLSIKNGINKKEYIISEIKNLLPVIIGILILYFGLYFGVFSLINFILTKEFMIDIIIFNTKLKTPIIIILIYLILFGILYLFKSYKLSKTNLIKFIK